MMSGPTPSAKRTGRPTYILFPSPAKAASFRLNRLRVAAAAVCLRVQSLTASEPNHVRSATLRSLARRAPS